jgi:hypothetical protein
MQGRKIGERVYIQPKWLRVTFSLSPLYFCWAERRLRTRWNQLKEMIFHFGATNILCDIITHSVAILHAGVVTLKMKGPSYAQYISVYRISCQSVPTQQQVEGSGIVLTVSYTNHTSNVTQTAAFRRNKKGTTFLCLPTAMRFYELCGMCGVFHSFDTWKWSGSDDCSKRILKKKIWQNYLFIKSYFPESKE